MLPTKTLSKILRETILIQNSHSIMYLTSFYVLIMARVICRTAEPLVDSDYWELNWKILAGFNQGYMILHVL